VRAFALAASQLPSDICLVIAGGGQGQSQAMAAAGPVADRVRCLGFVPDDDFAALMSGCLVFFFPTLFEGFGLPALEAMSCAAAVVTSATTSLPEVCGDAALLVDPHDVNALAAALVRVVSDTDLRQSLQRRGPERALGFSWSHAAEQTLDLYHEVATGR
jgi:glycosyltransferase involved in cell wall biosynthesis